MEAALEGDHGGPLRVRTRELDCVLDGLRARVEERGLARAGERRAGEQPLGERGVDFVRDDRVVGVGEAVELLVGCPDDLRV